MLMKRRRARKRLVNYARRTAGVRPVPVQAGPVALQDRRWVQIQNKADNTREINIVSGQSKPQSSN